MKNKLLITGAAGGMGRACARLLGMTHDLVLNDVAAPALEAFARELETEGYTIVATKAGDLCDDAVLAALVANLSGGAPFAVVHTAGLSPSQSDWETIMRVNLIGTAKLVEAVEAILVPGSVAILIASTAGHQMPPIPDADKAMAAALEPDLIGRLTALVEMMAPMAGSSGAAGISYSLSKRGVLTLCERKAAAWGAKGARIMTISPGLILTPMGRKEVAETEGAAAVMNAAPAGRPGTAMDIAQAVRFLSSPEASFITGSDLRVDGGSVSAMRA